MNQYVKSTILVILVLVFLVPDCCAADNQSGSNLGTDTAVIPPPAGSAVALPEPIAIPQPTTAPDPAGNYTKLEIQPSYMNFVVDPGEKKEMTVTVRNRDSKTAHVQPMVRQQPYSGPYVAESSWISVTPASADIAAGGSAKFTVAVVAPEGTLRGMYSSMLTFTDEAYLTAYPQPFPSYIHTLGLTINVASSPAIQISTPYINDQLESGGEYAYTVDVKNKGTTPLALNAKIGDDGYPMYGPYGVQEPPLTAKDFIINAPRSIAPGQNGTVTLNVNVPRNASGYYNGNVDLGIDDPSVTLEENRIQLSFQIWKQPEGGFTKKFIVPSQESISIELTSAMPMMMPMSPSGTPQAQPKRAPSFDTILTGPNGNANLVLVEKEIKGSVNLGTDSSLMNSDQPATYQETGSQYVFTYSAQGTPGQWTLAVMPRNTQSFDYKISLGGKDSSPSPSLFTLPSFFMANITGK
jgi:hypothetical protein